MSFEDAVQQSMFSGSSDKSFIDKLLGRKDVESIKEIIKKDRLSREDLMELMYMLSSIEMKLVNYGEWDRYMMAKYFVWIREFVAVCESLYDYKDDLDKKENNCKSCGKPIEGNTCKEHIPILKLNDRTKQLFENNMRLMEHNIKFLIDLYFNLSRTTLSLGGTGLLELLKNKYELVYPQQQMATQPQQQNPVQFKWKK